MFTVELSVVKLEAVTSADVIRALASRLLAAGQVAASFERAALAREKRSPTGLPFDPWPVALPHAEPEHVLTPAIAMATLASPVRFRQMGSPAIALDASIVVMPAFNEKAQAGASLARLVALLQDGAVREALVEAATALDLLRVLSESWDEP